MSRGLVHLYTGNGKGKTTAALGLSLRALGAGYDLYFYQFMKMGDSSEFRLLKEMEGVHTGFFGLGKFVNREKKDEDYRKEATSNRQGFNSIFTLFKTLAQDNEKGAGAPAKRQLVVLDEICLLLYFEFVSVDEVVELIKAKPDSVELVLTGRKAPAGLVEHCDYVSEVQEIKHPFQKGIPARHGIES